MTITKQNIIELIDFLKNEANSDNFNQRNNKCWGNRLAQICGLTQNYLKIHKAFTKQFNQNFSIFHSNFKDGDPLKIAQWLEEEILTQFDNDKWVTDSRNQHSVTILHVDSNNLMVGYYTVKNGETINGIWNKKGRSVFANVVPDIMTKKATYKINVPYRVTEDFTIDAISMTFPINCVITWLDERNVIDASLIETEGKFTVNQSLVLPRSSNNIYYLEEVS